MNSTKDGFFEKSSPPGRKEIPELPDDPRLMQAVQEYLKQLEAGQAPNRQEVLRRYPDLEGPLGQCLDGLELVHKAAVRKKGSQSGQGGSAPGAGDVMPANPLGDFQIMREIGRGGMGIVYEALQLSLGRRVALKVLPFAATFDAKHLQRFHNEAQAAAQLHHTNIVPVYAVGCERGVHFYAMQLIEGQSLATVIHQIKRQESQARGERSTIPIERADGGTATGSFVTVSGIGQRAAEVDLETDSPLSVALTAQRSNRHAKFFPTVAKFMVQAAEAVEYAHQSGIVHRDIKPANLLVDVHNRLWITDFGLAQFHADAGLTQTGDILGTLRYMSPEQASGTKVLDHRTDVYSLGATLYELVTLEPIFPGRNRQELLQQIINEEPRQPSMLEKSVPVELETIILKAVSKNLADRYNSAQELADDLQRYLEDKPILAKRPTLMERTRKWSRRHPSVVIASMVILVVCLVALGINNWMIAQEQAKTQEALQHEKDRAMEARRAVGDLVEIAASELADQPQLEGLRKRLLRTALTYYADFIATHGDDPSAQKELAQGKDRAVKLLEELSTLEGKNLLGLATNPDVQLDLKADDVTRAKLASVKDAFFAPRMKDFGGRHFDTSVSRQREYASAKKQEAALKQILSPKQLERLQQINLQSQGAKAFHDSNAVDDLKLTADQKAKIRDLKYETKNKFQACMQDTNLSPNEASKEIDQIFKDEMTSILGLLTRDQTARWQALIGEPFQGTLHRGPPFGGKGRPKNGPPGHRGGPPPDGPHGPP